MGSLSQLLGTQGQQCLSVSCWGLFFSCVRRCFGPGRVRLCSHVHMQPHEALRDR